MDDNFLHKIDLKTLQNEVKAESAESIGRFLQMKNPKGVYNWAKDKDVHGSRPSFNDIIRLLQKGASVKTLFGVERKNSNLTDDQKFQEGLQVAQKPMTRDEVIALFKSMKEKGEI